MLQVIILAAGQGKRMHSKQPKALHCLAGKPLLEYIVNSVQGLKPEQIYVVYGFGGDQLLTQLSYLPVRWVQQQVACGTGHAAAQVIPWLEDEARILILPGDTPLISLATLEKLLQSTPKDQVGFISSLMANPSGFGRVLRDGAQQIIGIVEEQDASIEQKYITEVNSGIFVISGRLLKYYLPRLQRHNAQSEYYLPDIIAIAATAGVAIHGVQAICAVEVQGINDRLQLAQLERHQQKQQAEQLLQAGLGLQDPNRFDLRGELKFGIDVIIDSNVIIEGKVSLGEGTTIGPYTLLRNVQIGSNVQIKAHSIIEESIIGDRCVIGPFARLRPGTQLASDVQVGNFVELKNSQIAQASKINHLSYVGDAVVGQQVIIGAGTITCNYDGINKHRTTIQDKAFIGSNTALIAPLTVGYQATIGAGSVLTKDAPAEMLTLSRAQQRSIPSWHKPQQEDDSV